MNYNIKGCGQGDKPLTLYLISVNGEASALSGSYNHVRCGYRPPSKLKNGILVCEACVEKLGLPLLRGLLRDSSSVRVDSPAETDRL